MGTACFHSDQPGLINLIGHMTLFLQMKHLLYKWGQKITQIPLPIKPKAVGHDLAGKTVATE